MKRINIVLMVLLFVGLTYLLGWELNNWKPGDWIWWHGVTVFWTVMGIAGVLSGLIFYTVEPF